MKTTAKENIAKLPAFCFVIDLMTNGIIKVVAGESGYYRTPYDSDATQAQADALNKKLGVNRAQAEAMMVGSMFGWEVPGANPDRYHPETGGPNHTTCEQCSTTFVQDFSMDDPKLCDACYDRQESRIQQKEIDMADQAHINDLRFGSDADRGE